MNIKGTFLTFLLLMSGLQLSAQTVDLTGATIVYDKGDAPLVAHMAQVLADDIERVTGKRPQVAGVSGKAEKAKIRGSRVVLATADHSSLHRELRGTWERYAIDTKAEGLCITGSDARGLAYGVFHVSEAIGVSPWYWFADVPIDKTNRRVYGYAENCVSQTPSVKYRGIFINDEDWGLKTWAARNYEKELGDIGPKTYDRVCELLLRLKGNMLAPAMHTCTGAFYSHPESQQMADKWGIMITTSHCEPLLFNNAAPSEWDKRRDGEWNYETNSATILKKLDDRIRETAQYDNIYTMGLRGLHDEAMKGSKDPKDRARTLEKVIAKQREILEKYKGQKAEALPQIFVPYKEALDIYDAGLRVPEDITLVWPDDNFGYMKRVSNAQEQQRSGHSGVYYHISYLGTPHDYLWIATTAPMLMYEELKKAYDAGGDRYWLLNVGDIKPMELEMQQFFDMAYDLPAFTYDNVNSYQAHLLARLFSVNENPSILKSLNPSISQSFNLSIFQSLLDTYYRLAWDRKPEFMGYEMEWDNKENNRLHDSGFSFETGTAQQRLADYERISQQVDSIERALDAAYRPAFFQLIGFSVKAAYQMNRKFLMAQKNHETGSAEAAQEAREAYDSIQALVKEYNSLLNGKWDQMMSVVPPGICAKYQQMPELVTEATDAFRLPDAQRHPEFCHQVDLTTLTVHAPFRLLHGIGTDWVGLQMGEGIRNDELGMTNDELGMKNEGVKSEKLSFVIPLDSSIINHHSSINNHHSSIINHQSSINLCLSVVPVWPVSTDRSNRFAVSVDGGEPVVCENKFKEWSDEWKVQVLENRKEFVVTLPLDTTRQEHIVTLTIIDPGQIIQKITYQ